MFCRGSFVGWRVQNDGKLLMAAVGKCESCSNFDFSYNGLGDREAEALGKALGQNYRSVRARRPPSRCSCGCLRAPPLGGDRQSAWGCGPTATNLNDCIQQQAPGGHRSACLGLLSRCVRMLLRPHATAARAVANSWYSAVRCCAWQQRQ